MRYLESLNLALDQIMSDNQNAVIIGEDIKDPYGGAFKVTKGLSSKYGHRVISSPISESSIVGLGIGLSLNGFKPIVEIMFGDFITLCADQIINGASKFPWMYGSNFDLPMIIRTPMGGRRGYGPTHSQTLESLFFNIPNIKIISPSIFHDPGQILKDTFYKMKELNLFIENKISYPNEIILKEQVDDYNISIINNNTEFVTLSLVFDRQTRPDIVLLTYGGMSNICFEVARDLFIEEEIIIEIIIPSLVKPVPFSDFHESIISCGKLVIVEEGISICGWGSMITSNLNDELFDSLKAKPVIVGSKEFPIASSRKLEDKILPQKSDIKKAILKNM